MISILIPVHDYPLVDLVKELHRQGLESGQPFEIVVLNDGSQSHTEQFDPLAREPRCEVHHSDHNLGRSAARNKLAAMAQYDHLLFLDCDGFPVRTDFFGRYLEKQKIGTVVIGGTRYEPSNNPKYSLHLAYGTKREAKVEGGFQSNNFLIAKADFAKVGGFDEELTEYGHEDTLLGVELRRKGIEFLHFDNPVYHQGLEENEVFVEKSLIAAESAWQLYKSGKINPEEIRLLSFFLNLNQNALKRIALKFIEVGKPLWRKLCLSPNPSLVALDLLKVCRLKELSEKDEK